MSQILAKSGAVAVDEVPVRSLVHNKRIEDVANLFAAQYKQVPEFYVRVPGRVNLIGEHIDYCGYGVCPMAIEQDIFVAIGYNDNQQLHLTNTEQDYEDFSCNILDFKIDVSAAAGGPRWYKYFLCGVQGVAETLAEGPVGGMNVVVSGNVPQSAGLSSSSALVSAAVLATAYRNQLTISKAKLADLSAECEKYIGTQGGGMDQAIAFLASEGCAKLIEFNPLRSRDVVLPHGAVFVIAHSLAKLNKAATADFNCRVIECRLASQILAKRHGLSWRKLQKLGDLQEALGISLQSMCETVDKILHCEPYTKDEVCRELEVSPQELDEVSLTPNTRHIQMFKLHQRASHVFQEALRVCRFHEMCEKAAAAADMTNGSQGDDGRGVGLLSALGDLMTASHESLRDLYECSHPRLDRLVELSKGIAHGMRLTGAGWGGCAVALVPQSNVDKFIATLKQEFYKSATTDCCMDGDFSGQDGSLVFATSPNAGATIFVAST